MVSVDKLNTSFKSVFLSLTFDVHQGQNVLLKKTLKMLLHLFC